MVVLQLFFHKSIRHSLPSVLLLVLIAHSAPGATESPNIYAHISALNSLRAQTQGTVALTRPTPRPQKNGKDYTFGRYVLEQPALEQQSLTALARHDSYATKKGEVLFPAEAWENLGLTTPNSPVLNALGPTYTIFGRHYLLRLLLTPTTDSQLIAKRQNVIMALRSRPELTKRLRVLLGRLGKEQNHLIGLTDPQHPIYDKGLEPFFHKRPIRQLLSLSFENPQPGRKKDKILKIIDDLWKIGGPVMFSLASAKMLHKSYTNDIANEQYWNQLPFPALSGKLRPYAKIIGILASLYLLHQSYGIGGSLIGRHRVLSYFHSQLQPLKTLFITLFSCKKLVSLLPELHDLESEIDLSIQPKNNDLEELKKILVGPAFATNASSLHKTLWGGDIVHAIPLLKSSRHDLFKGCALIGALDAYLAIATALDAQQHDTTRPLCLARFLTRTTPYLSAQGLWHPAVSAEIQQNNLTLGSPQAPQNMIVTGLFESGKSTLLQAVILNTVLAQTIGICFARDFVCTAFSCINLYANIKDDLANDRSLFKTELYRAVQLLDYIKNLPPGAFNLTGTDCSFTGTEAGAGRAAACAVARYLGTHYSNTLSIHTTNFFAMGLLAEQFPTVFSAYYLPTTVTDDRIHHAYKLKPGIEKPHNSIAIFKEEGFPEEMVATMEKVLKRPQDYPTASLRMKT